MVPLFIFSVMKHSLILFIFITIATFTAALCMPYRQSNDREILSVGSSKESQKLVTQETCLDVERTGRRKNNGVLLRRNIDNDQETVQQRNPKLSARAETDDDDLTPEELDASLGEGKEDEEEPTAAKPERVTLEEVEPFLTPEERAAFESSRQRLASYTSARNAAAKAKIEGRELTTEEKKAIRDGNENDKLYKKLRRLGIKRLVESGNARPEVVAYWKAINSGWATLNRMTEAERKAYNKQKYARAREIKEAKQARLEELEARFRGKQATEEELQELAELQAWRDRSIVQSEEQRRKQKQSRAELDAEELEARNAQVRARRKQGREEKKAARETLKFRIEHDTATPEDRREWARIQEEAKQAKLDQAMKKARTRELEWKVQNKMATPEEEEEWENAKSKWERHKVNAKAHRDRKKQGITKGKGNWTKGDQRKGGRQAKDIAAQSDTSDSTEDQRAPEVTTDPSTDQPLQFSENLPSIAWMGNTFLTQQQANVAIPRPAGTRFAQPGNLPLSSEAFGFSTVKDGLVNNIKLFGDRLVNELGHTINRANPNPSRGGFLGGETPSLEVPHLGKVPAF